MHKRIRIAILIPGGIGTGLNNIGVPVLERLVKLLSKDFDITVFSLFKVNNNYKAEGFKLISINSSNALVKSIQLGFAFWKCNRQQKFETVHGFWALPSGILAVILAKTFGLKSVVSVLGGDAVALPEINYGSLRNWLPRNLVKWTVNNADEVTTLTTFLVNNLREHGLIRTEIKVIPWGVDLEQFTFREKVISNPLQILHIANLSPVKDQGTLLKTFKIISDKVPAHLTVIGEGMLEVELRNLTESLALADKITFRAPVPYEDIQSFYNRSDILLHTSRSEGQSEVVTEAMSSGVIVCGTQVGLIYDLPSCCVSVPIGDYHGLADKVIQLMNDPDRMKEIRSNAKSWTSLHSIHWTTRMITKLYSNLPT